MADIRLVKDSDKLEIGARSGGDLNLFHNATNSFIENETGILYVTNKANTSLILGTNSTTAVTIDNSQNVTMAGNIIMADDTSIGIADDAERIEFDGAGDISVLGANFGIGTTAPSGTLHVKSPASTHNHIYLETQTAAYASFLNFKIPAITSGAANAPMGDIYWFNGTDSL